jgi:UDP-glucuronate 4-epimerase
MTKKVLITGAAGFIGFHAAQAFKARGDFVIGYDNFNDYYDVELKNKRASILKEKGISIVKGDLCEPEKLTNLIKEHQITHLVHLAAQVGVRYSVKNPDVYIQSNLQGFHHILEICRNNQPLVLTYASTSSVYGLNEKIPFNVNDRTDSPVSLYGATKKANELMAFSYHHMYKIPVTGLRFFTVYGPWGRPDMAYYSFAKDIVKDKPIDVYNHGKMWRDFTYVDDIVSGIVSAADLESECEIFNLGNNKQETLEDFISIIEDSLGKKAQKNFLPMQLGDVLSTYADIDYSQEKLGFKPTTSLKDGMPKFVEWFKEYHNVSL